MYPNVTNVVPNQSTCAQVEDQPGSSNLATVSMSDVGRSKTRCLIVSAFNEPYCLHRSGTTHMANCWKKLSSSTMMANVSTCDLASCHCTWTFPPSMSFRIRAVQLGMQAWLHNPGMFAPNTSWRMISKAIWDSLFLPASFFGGCILTLTPF